MTAGYQEFPLTEPFKTSHPKLLANDKAALSSNAGTTFPTNPLEGMDCWRTDEKKLYRYVDGAWTLANIQGNAATATKLQTARTISLGGAASATPTAFDGTGNISIPVTGFKEAYLGWGGKNYSGSFGPLDASLVDVLGANRFAFGKPEGLVVEYSRDGGATWVDYGATDAQKIALTVGSGVSFTIGKAGVNEATKDYQVRIVINTKKFNIYTGLQKFVINVSTNGCSGTWCTIDGAKHEDNSTFIVLANKVGVSGWSGFNVINVPYFETYGNFNSQIEILRFTFGCTGVSADNPNNYNVTSIRAFGGNGWVTPSNMAMTGHLYSYDSAQNATFPAAVKASQFIGNAATQSVAGLMSATDKAKLDVAAPLASPALTGTPTAPTAAATINNTQIATTAFVFTAIANDDSSLVTALNNLATAWG